MKICLISRKFDENSGSGEWVYAAKLSVELKRLGIDIHLIEQKNSGLFSKRAYKLFHDWIRVPIKCMGLYFFCNIKNFHFLSENQGMCIPLLNFFGANTIVTFHDLMRLSGKNETVDKKYFRLVYKLASKAKKIQCNSTETKKDLLSNFKIKSLVKVIPVNCREFNIVNKKKMGNILGYLGALNARKRPEKLLEIEKELINQHEKLKIIVWGKGEYFDKIKNKKKNLIILRGFAPEEDLNQIYNSFDFFIFPTSCEGLGLPAIESAMCGIPIFIYSDAKIPREIKKLCIVCKNSKEMVKKVLKLKQNSKKLREIKKTLLVKSKKFSFKDNTNKLIKLYDK